MQRYDVAIVGGSVAGHASALALGRSESRRVWRVGGESPTDVTVLLWPRGVRALEQLGVPSADQVGVRARVLRYRDGTGAVLSEIDVERSGLRLVRRSSVTLALAAKIPSKNVKDTARNVDSMLLENRAVRLRAGADEALASVVVGAAGIADPVRTMAFGPTPFVEGGTIVVGETRAPDVDGFGGDGVVEMLFGRSAFLGVLPSPDRTEPAAGRVTWWLLVPGPITAKGKDALADATAIVGRYFEAPMRSMVERSSQVSVLPRRRWVHPLLPAGTARIALVGDAFRAATPDLGLGVTWALEDAVRLGECIDARGLILGVGDYVRATTVTSYESILGRMFSRFVAREDAYPLRRLAMGAEVFPRAAVQCLSALS